MDWVNDPVVFLIALFMLCGTTVAVSAILAQALLQLVVLMP